MTAIAVLATSVLILPVLLMTVVGAVVTGLDGGGTGRQVVLAAAADIPEPMATLYKDAARRYRLAWPLLAAVGKVECDHNRLRDARGELRCLRPNAVGAVGPMQFLPETFAEYAPLIGPDASIVDEHDSVHAAAAKLVADGAHDDVWGAVRSYNPSDSYAATVLAWAVRYGWFSDDRQLLGRAALAHPRLQMRADARHDVSAGRVDPRLLGTLLTLAATHRVGGIGPFTRHHCLVNGTTHLSNHVYGRAVDVFVIDGVQVSAGNLSARRVVGELLTLPRHLAPDEIGQPWPDLAATRGVFTDADHRGHLHLGFETGSGASNRIHTPGCVE